MDSDQTTYLIREYGVLLGTDGERLTPLDVELQPAGHRLADFHALPEGTALTAEPVPVDHEATSRMLSDPFPGGGGGAMGNLGSVINSGGEGASAGAVFGGIGVVKDVVGWVKKQF